MLLAVADLRDAPRFALSLNYRNSPSVIGHGYDDKEDCSAYQLLDRGVYAADRHADGQKCHRQAADDRRAEPGTGTARNGTAAQQYGYEDIELCIGGHRRRGSAGPQDAEESKQSAERADQYERQDLDLCHIDAGLPGRFLVRADGFAVFAELCVFKEDITAHAHTDQNDDPQGGAVPGKPSSVPTGYCACCEVQ